MTINTDLAKTILENWEEAKKNLPDQTEETYVECVCQFKNLLYNKQYKINEKEAEQVSLFMKDCSYSLRLLLWTALQTNAYALYTLFPFINKLIIDTSLSASEEEKNRYHDITKKWHVAEI